MKKYENDRHFVETLVEPLRTCASYVPKLGTSDVEGVGLSGFQQIYSEDSLYHWVGLDSPLMYAAHKAAGGMTSIYRQLGIGCERFFQSILETELGLSRDDLAWGYDARQENGKTRRLELDARIDSAQIASAAIRGDRLFVV